MKNHPITEAEAERLFELRADEWRPRSGDVTGQFWFYPPQLPTESGLYLVQYSEYHCSVAGLNADRPDGARWLPSYALHAPTSLVHASRSLTVGRIPANRQSLPWRPLLMRASGLLIDL